ncbi:MAG: protein-L-isoaspartate(D-aspartate) O-methyltransferase [Magnetococcales bacterium]|nr:protein-L-isoaspartate(D-aspartate) O-methyltransferase [Magnetococcales bacterium]MBF0157103.1 protein-L-isoaspartate(D-aspartate) O-methyltransferase [Magnetococcales bacterium]
MVRRDLLPRGIRDQRVITAMTTIPRECFVEAGIPLEEVYADGPLAIGLGQTISQPYMVALMAELLQLTGRETVLEIGTGSGYGAAILSRLAERVVTIERHRELLEKASGKWQSLGLCNIFGQLADGSQGWSGESPYGAICVTAAALRVPGPLLDQILPGGRMVIPLGSRSVQSLCVIHLEASGQYREEQVCGCRFVPLIGREGW